MQNEQIERSRRVERRLRASGLRGTQVLALRFVVLPVIFVAFLLVMYGCDDFLTKNVKFGVRDDATDDGSGDGGGSDIVDDDADGLSNQVEELNELDPRSSDTDQDGYSDGLEFVSDLADPLDASKIPRSQSRAKTLSEDDVLINQIDTDDDGLGDNFEEENELDPQSPFTDDDGYSDSLELLAESDPFLGTDRPQRATAPVSDGVARNNAPPADTDRDGIGDEQEGRDATDPRKADSDTDGFSDGVEFLMGSNPNSSVSIPNFNVPEPPVTTTSTTGSTTLSSSSTSSTVEEI